MKVAAPRPRPPFLFGELGLFLAPLVLFAPLWAAGKAMFWGTPALQFVPWWNFAVQVLQAGELPLWNPLVGMGAPLSANYQSALFYPPTWLLLLLGGLGGVGWIAWGQAVLVALHLGWAGLGMARLARSLGLRDFACLLSGLAFGLSIYLVGRSGFLSIIFTAAWLPWTAMYAGQVIRSSSRKSWLGLTLVLALLLLAGHAQTAWYTLLLSGAWSVFWSWSDPFQDGVPTGDRLHLLPARLARLVSAGALALGLSAVQLLLTLEYLMQSQRSSAVDFSLAMTYSFWPWRILTFFAPDLFGSPVRGDYWGYATYWEDAGYLGLLPLLLALYVLIRQLWRTISRLEWVSRFLEHAARGLEVFRGWAQLTLKLKLGETGEKDSQALPVTVETRTAAPWQNPALVPFLGGVVIVALVLALGKNTPIFPWLYRHVPTFDMFQAPARILIWAEFGLALLAGIGAQSWRRPQGAGLYWTRLGTMGAVAVMLGAGLGLLLMGDVSPTFIRATWLFGVWGAVAGVLSLLAPGLSEPFDTWRHRGWQVAVLMVVAADLLVAGWGLQPAVGLDFYDQPASFAQEIKDLAQGGRIYLYSAAEPKLKFKRFLRFSSFNPREPWGNLRQVLLPNLNMLDGVASANNFDPLIPGRYARWMVELTVLPVERQTAWLQRMGVSLVERTSRTQRYGVRFRRVPDASLLRWTPCARQATDGEHALSELRNSSIDLNQWVVLEIPQVKTFQEVCPAGEILGSRDAQILLVKHTALHWVIEVEAPSGGWLVVSQVYYPGWQAKVNGERVGLLRGDYLFQAFAVPAGASKVELAYNPWTFQVGAALSSLCWLGLGMLGVLHLRARLRSRSGKTV